MDWTWVVDGEDVGTEWRRTREWTQRRVRGTKNPAWSGVDGLLSMMIGDQVAARFAIAQPFGPAARTLSGISNFASFSRKSVASFLAWVS